MTMPPDPPPHHPSDGPALPGRPVPPAAPLPAAGPGRPVAPVQVVQRGPSAGTLLLTSFAAIAAAGLIFVIGFFSPLVLLGVAAAGAAGGGGGSAPALADQLVAETLRDGPVRRTVAVLPIEGVIDAGVADFLRAAVVRTLDDPHVQAVVVRIDSPGGGVTASDHLWYEIGRLRERGLPVVASFGGVAASGGYYAAMSSDHIVAEPTTITGSIGVIAQVMTFGSLVDKVGIEPVTLVASGSPSKDVANDVFRSWTDEDRAKLGEILDAAYATFLDRVREGRKAAITDEGELQRLCDGSVYTADAAKAKGLVDSIGYFDDAVAEAERRAGLAPGSARVVRYALPFDVFSALLGVRSPGDRTGTTLREAAMLDADTLRTFVNELGSVRLQYLMH